MPHYKIHDSYSDKLRILINRARNKVTLLEKRNPQARSSGEMHSELWLVIDFRKSEAEIFSHLRKTYLGWRHKVGRSARKCEIVGRADQRDSQGEEKIRGLCERWNQDIELNALSALNFIFIVEAGVQPWMGFISSVAPAAPMAKKYSATMRVFDFKQEHAQEVAANTAWIFAHAKQNEERLTRELEEIKKKNVEEARNPMPVPRSIARELAAYLRLEFGETWWHPRSLKARHLKFVGEYVVDGVTTQYWSFPTSTGPMWATVERFDESYNLGMTSDPPPTAQRV